MLVLTIIFSILGFYFLSDLANTILVESLRQLATSHIIMNLSFIKFDLNLILFDSCCMIIIALISTLMPMIKLKHIKPVDIIKAKE